MEAEASPLKPCQTLRQLREIQTENTLSKSLPYVHIWRCSVNVLTLPQWRHPFQPAFPQMSLWLCEFPPPTTFRNHFLDCYAEQKAF